VFLIEKRIKSNKVETRSIAHVSKRNLKTCIHVQKIRIYIKRIPLK
jgi:hypothetical protein